MMVFLSTAIIQESTYIVRWPPWVGGIIALGMMATIMSAGSEALRRHFGLRTMWIGAGVASLVMAIFLITEVLRGAQTSDQPSAFLASTVAVIAMFLAPGYGVWRGSRAQSTTYASQIGRGILAAFGFVILAFVGGLLVAVVFQRVR